MESAEDFLVVDNGSDSAPSDTISELRYVINLFHSSIDSLNQSTVLLRDELQNSLSAALQRLTPDDSIDTEEILKSFNRSVTSTDDVRREYVKRLCTRLVTIEAEKQALQTECAQLKAGTWLADECEEIKTLDQLITEILCSVRRLEKEAGVPTKPSAAPTEQHKSTLSLITFRVAEIQDRLSKLHVSSADQESKKAGNDETVNDTNIKKNDEEKTEKPKKKNSMSKSEASHQRFQRKVEQMLGLAGKSVAFQEETDSSDHEESAEKTKQENAAFFNYPNVPPLMNTNLLWTPNSSQPLYPPGPYQNFPNYGPRFGRPMFHRVPFSNDPRQAYMMYGNGPMHYQPPWRGGPRAPYRPYKNKRSSSRPATPKTANNASQETNTAAK